MSDYRGSSSRYSSTSSSIHYASLTSTKIKDLITGRTDKTKDPKQKHIFVNKRGSMFLQHEGKVEKPSEDENSMFSNTDEHSKPDINANVGELDPKLKVCCPHCHKRIDSVIEGLVQDIKNWASSSVSDSQLSEKVKTHYFPAKKNFMAESLNSSHVFDTGMMSDTKVRPLSNRNIANIQGTLGETAKSANNSNAMMSNLLYELAEHKAKLAAALHTNDENLYELQKRQTEIRQLQMNYLEKEKEYSKLEKEFFLVKQENYKCKATIHELNTNHKMLLKDFNKFTKLQISIKTEAG